MPAMEGVRDSDDLRQVDRLLISSGSNSPVFTNRPPSNSISSNRSSNRRGSEEDSLKRNNSYALRAEPLSRTSSSSASNPSGWNNKKPLAIADSGGNGGAQQLKGHWPIWQLVAALGLLAALVTAVSAFFWLRVSTEPMKAAEPGVAQVAPEDREDVAASIARGHANAAVSQRDNCCSEKTAKCMACKMGWSVAEFCADRDNQHVEGCERHCCKEKKASCLACHAGLALPAFCEHHSHVPGCKGVCCTEMTAKCLACRDDVSTKEYCSKPENARVSGCESDHTTTRRTTSLRQTTTVAMTTSRTTDRCCHEWSAKCLACKVRVSVRDYCLDLADRKVPGCSGYCGFMEAGYVYPGGNLFDVKEVATADACCEKCRTTPNCTSWSWGGKPGTTYHGWCYLKNQMEFIRHKDDAFVSGLPGRNMMTYQVKNRHGICLDWGGQLHLEECGGSDRESQKWYIDRGAGIIGTKNGHCLDSVEYLSEGGGIHLQPCTANLPSQRWDFDGISGLVKHARGFCMEAPKQQEAGSSLRMWPCDAESPQQLWSFWNSAVLGQSATLQAMRLEALTTTTTSTLSQSTTTETATTTTVTTIPLPPAPSLFCWSLMLPWGYEHTLLELQYKMSRSIFACEGSAVYSSKVINITGGEGRVVQTHVVHHDLHCKIGGEFMTALNTPIFLHVWKVVIADGIYKEHDWTIKADPDAVFFPARLQALIAAEDIGYRGGNVFLNNCKFGLHGPLEVLSRGALDVYDAGWETCEQPPQEDVFLMACMLKLGVKQVDVFDLLAEEHCKSEGWELCQDQHAAFHPFKTVDKYAECLTNAGENKDYSNFGAAYRHDKVSVLHA